MPQTIELTGATGTGLRCDLRPDLGGCVAGFWLGEEAVLRSAAGRVLQDVRGSANFPLLPYGNRMGQRTLVWRGKRHALSPNFDGQPHSLHGNGWQRPWAVLEQTASRAVLALAHTPDSDWPFAFECIQTIALDHASLRLTLAFTNREATPAPAGLGWHPYIARRCGAQLAFSAGTRWDTGSDQLPERAVPIEGLDAACDSLALNNCFDDWNGIAHVDDEVMQIQVASDLPRLQVSTPAGKDFLAVEPVSHVPDAFNQGEAEALARGMRVLGAGEAISAWMTISPRLRA
ncbi:MAG: aldose 1-epimerase [Polaromonas sp.]|uniref:aldose 1-epimerase n=1 Tax=Polaromonas sp. TaxID=1869339 RepID=UPI0040371EFD